MRKDFYGFYPPSKAEFERLWKNGKIVLDTNVLLDLYRLPTVARKEFFDLLTLLKDRLWIPHQVALEFQKNRLSVISSARSASEKALRDTNRLHDELTNSVKSLEIDRRDLGIDISALLKSFSESKEKLSEALEKAHSSQADVSADDSIREEIDEIFASKVGAGPEDAGALAALVIDGDDRYLNRIPPGYMDVDKEKNPNEATFWFDGKEFERKFGDLIAWRQILHFAKTEGIKDLLFVTSDSKEDWWWIDKGKTIGPRPELIREICAVAGVDNFWMYSPDQFLQNAPTFTEAKITEDSVSEMREVSRVSAKNRALLSRHLADAVAQIGAGSDHPSQEWRVPIPNSRQSLYARREPSIVDIEREAARAISQRFGQVTQNSGFPDLIIERDGQAIGFEVRYIRNFTNPIFPPSVINTMLRGYLEVNEGRLSDFGIILVVSYEDYERIEANDRIEDLTAKLRILMDRYRLNNLIFASYDELLGMEVRFEM